MSQKGLEIINETINLLYIKERFNQCKNSIVFKHFNSSVKWSVLAHFLTPNFTPKILTHKILTPDTHA